MTGNPDALNLALDFTARCGRVTLTGCSRTPTREIDFYSKVHKPGIWIIGAHNMVRPQHERRPGYWTMREDMALLLRLFSAGRIRPERLITDLARPAEAPRLFARLAKDLTAMRKIRIGQIGIGHNHASEKMAALRRLSDIYEVVGVVEPDEEWWEERGNLAAYQGIPRLTEEELFRTENLEAIAVETDGFELLETAR